MSLFETSASAVTLGFKLAGITVSIQRDNGVFDPVAGTKPENLNDIEAKIIFKNIESDTTKLSESIQGKTIMLGDKGIVSDVELMEGDKFTIDSVTWRVFGALPKIVDGKNLCYIGFVRSNG